jgi:macrolide-specific efflux system membrane fusion protein
VNTTWLICFLAIAGDPAPRTIESALLTAAEQAEVPAQDAGVVTEVVVREGDVVRAGQPIARLDASAASLARARAQIELERARKLAGNDIQHRSAQKELAFARAEYERAIQSEEKLPGSVSLAERDRLRLQAERAELDVAQAAFELSAARLAVSLFENELQIADEKLQRRRIVAPISGFVVAISRRTGEWVEPGQVVVRVLAIDRLRVEFFLQSDEATADLVGKPVRFIHAGLAPNSPCVGNIAFVSPEVDPLNGQVRVWAEIDNREGRLRPGLAGTLTILP